MAMTIKGLSVFNGGALELKVEDALIAEIRGLAPVSERLPYISPGFLDMQVNGYAGHDYSLEDLTLDNVERIIASLAASGTTQHVATIVSVPQERLVRNLATIARGIRESSRIREAIVGIHVEGPFISPESGPRGAHDSSFIRDPDQRELAEWREASEGHLSIITVAPERPGALELIRLAVDRGITVAIGHSAAEPEQIRKAIEAGARLSTHLGNGSHTLIPRLKNYIWEQLAADELAAGIIADGFHLPAAVVKVMSRVKGLERLILVSDVTLPGGFSPGIYKWGNLDVEVFSDGHLGLPETDILAGAGHLLDWDLAHFVQFTGCSLGEAVRLCTINPARILKLPPLYGTLEKEAPANLAVFHYNPGEPRLRIEKTILAGREVS